MKYFIFFFRFVTFRLYSGWLCDELNKKNSTTNTVIITIWPWNIRNTSFSHIWNLLFIFPLFLFYVLADAWWAASRWSGQQEEGELFLREDPQFSSSGEFAKFFLAERSMSDVVFGSMAWYVCRKCGRNEWQHFEFRLVSALNGSQLGECSNDVLKSRHKTDDFIVLFSDEGSQQHALSNRNLSLRIFFSW